MSHYHPDDFKELEEKHEMENVDMSHYTDQMWFDEIKQYLVEVMGANEKQIKAEFDKRFPGLLVRDLF